MAKTIKDFQNDMAAMKSIAEANIKLYEEERNQLSGLFNIKRRMLIDSQIIAENNKIIAEYEKKAAEYSANGHKIHASTLNAMNKKRAELQKQNSLLETGIAKKQRILNITNSIGNALSSNNKKQGDFFTITGNVFKELNKQDKIIRQTTLSLGMTGVKADMLRQSFNDAAMEVAFLGGNLESIKAAMEGYASASGRSKALSSKMVEDIVAIGLGTGIGVQEAAKMAGQFEIMGVDIAQTKKVIQDMVISGEKYGINTKASLDMLNRNFKSLNAMTFQNGVKSMANMALQAEKMKISMESAIGSANMMRNLDKSLEVAATLQTLGGEFAKTDPLELLFLSRNDPEKYTKKIGEMTRSLVTLKKNSDGSFSRFISPADIDRLSIAAQKLNLSKEEIVQISQREFDSQKIASLLSGSGFTPEQRKIVDGMAMFNSETGQYMVKIGDISKSITALTTNDIKAIEKQNVTLNDRARLAQDFDTALKQTIDAFRSTLLPVLKGVNTVLITIKPFVETVAGWTKSLLETNFGKTLLYGAGMIMAASVALKAAVVGIRGSMIGSLFGGGGASRAGGRTVGGRLLRNTGGGRVSAAAGKGMMKGGLGMGAAGLGIGAGIGAAAFGISQLADSIKDLDIEKLRLMNHTLLGLGVGIGVLTVVGILATKASVGLLAVGGAVLLIGGGIALATMGIGKMGKGLAELATASKGSGKDMLQFAEGLNAMGNAMLKGSLGRLLGGVGGLRKAMAAITEHSSGMAVVGEAFKNIHAVLSADKEDFKEIESIIKSIASTTVSKNNVFSELVTLLKSPLKVEFSEKSNVVSEITLEIDGEKFMKKVYKHNLAVEAGNNLRKQKA